MNVCIRILAGAAVVGSLEAGPARAGFVYTKFDGPSHRPQSQLIEQGPHREDRSPGGGIENVGIAVSRGL